MILVTGGAGYIGSHTIVELLQAGKDVVVLDNFSNSTPEVFMQIARIAGRAPSCWIRGDIRDEAVLDMLFRTYPITQVIHFAGLKAVGESVAQPARYYDVNVMGTLALLSAMDRHNVQELVFSSSATVYGDAASMPLSESALIQPTNPYGETKAAVEAFLRNRVRQASPLKVAALRYFNPAGAHASGLLGENPTGVPNNLVPFISQVATGQRPQLTVFGRDYATPDGTGVRDYIHVMDLAKGHLAALTWLSTQPAPVFEALNLGSGAGFSVLEVHQAFEEACGHAIPLQFASRRAGDVAACWADPARANQLLGWRTERTLPDICADAWRWVRSS